MQSGHEGGRRGFIQLTRGSWQLLQPPITALVTVGLSGLDLQLGTRHGLGGL